MTMNENFAFILGNGKTRLEVDIDQLNSLGVTFGCNRVYEEFVTHHLISADKGMAHEIQKSGYSAKHKHYTRKLNIIKGSGALEILHPQYAGFSSGPAAVGMACYFGHSYIFLIGMDLHSDNDTINNLYAGTMNYKSDNAQPTYFGNWVLQVRDVMRQFTNNRFIHVNPLDGFSPEEWKSQDNFQIMDLPAFELMINN